MTEPLVEPLPQPQPPETLHAVLEPSPELARKNMYWASGLVVLFLVLFGGTFAVAGIWLWLT